MALLGGLASLVWWKEREHLARPTALTALVQLAVPAGANAQTFPLADGSRVTLAPGSTLRSRGDFGESARTLALEGEALFNVADGEAPFVVEAAGVRVEDVSTAFVVRALPAIDTLPPRALVAVTQGAVRVEAGGTTHPLGEGQALLLDERGRHITLDPTAARGSVAWTSGALLFSDEPVASVVERLERWTGLTIAVDTVLRTRRLTVAIEAESPAATVQHVAEALGARAVAASGSWRLTAR